MSLGDLFSILRIKWADFTIWLLAYLGGMLMMYSVCFTIWILHKHLGPFLPRYEIFLITGTICLAVTGVSYHRLKLGKKGVTLSPLLSFSWPFLIAGVYGVLISAGVKQPSRPSWILWIISIILFVCLLIWASAIWLHEQGIKAEMESEPRQPEVSKDLERAAQSLPKVQP